MLQPDAADLEAYLADHDMSATTGGPRSIS
jgi:hypothetical protein